jgi:hypothetical protein
MKNSARYLLSLLLLCATGFSFQNCSQNKFSSMGLEAAGTSSTQGVPSTGGGAPGSTSPITPIIGEATSTGNIIVLDPVSANAMSLSGNASIRAKQIAVNSKSSQALTLSGGANVTANQVYISGDYTASGNASVQKAVVGAAPATDPLANLTAPSTTGLTVYPGGNISAQSNITLNPGVYSAAVQISGGASVSLNPGVYIFENGLVLSGGSYLKGSGVLLYVAGGEIDLSGDSTSQLSPAATGPYAGVTIFQSRTDSTQANLSGGSDWVIEGTLYFPDAPVNLSGSSNLPQSLSLITWQLSLSGGSFIFGSD